MKEVVRAGLSCNDCVFVDGLQAIYIGQRGKLPLIPGATTLIVIIEEVNLFAQGWRDRRMLNKIMIQRCCSTASRANDNKVREHAQATGGGAICCQSALCRFS